MIFFTGRMDMTVSLSDGSRMYRKLRGGTRRHGKPYHQRGELIEEAFQKAPRAVVGDIVVGVDQARLERYIVLAAHQQNALGAEDLAKVLLRERGADRARRRAGDGGELPGPVVLAPRPRAPIDGVLELRRDRTVVLGRHKQKPVRRRDLGFEANHARRQIALV